MNKLKIWTRRSLMSLLFLGAVFTTFHSISGVEAKTLSAWWNQQDDTEYSTTRNNQNHTLKSIGLSFKWLKRFTQPETFVSSATPVETAPRTLEEAIDWSKYPKKQVVATGYTAGVESTGKDPSHPQYGITYSGVKVKRDLYSTVAADLNVFPIGTILFIPGYGYGVVADKGGAIKGNKLDLYYETVAEVYEQWGKKTVDVYIVELGNGKLTEDQLVLLNENESMQVFRQQYIQTKPE